MNARPPDDPFGYGTAQQPREMRRLRCAEPRPRTASIRSIFFAASVRVSGCSRKWRWWLSCSSRRSYFRSPRAIPVLRKFSSKPRREAEADSPLQTTPAPSADKEKVTSEIQVLMRRPRWPDKAIASLELGQNPGIQSELW